MLCLRTLTNRALPWVAALALAGCVNLPATLPDKTTAEMAIADLAKESDWASPAIQEDGMVGIVLLEPASAPDAIRSRQVSIRMEGNTTLSDLAALITRELKVPVFIADSSVGTTSVSHLRYVGTLGGLLDLVAGISSTHFSWRGGGYVTAQTERYVVTAPQETDYLSKIAAELTALRVSAYASETAGFVTIDAKPQDVPVMKEYLARVGRNAAVVSLQVGVINVALTRGRNTGVDWSKMALSVGKGVGPAVASSSPSTSSSSSLTEPGVRADMSGAALAWQGVRQGFSFTGLLSFLETYGDAKTLQNTMLTTVAGKEVSLISAVNTPYVSSVGVGTVGASDTTTGSTVGTATTATAKSGVTLKFNPKFDADANLVTLSLSLKVDSVLGTAPVSAGNQLGSLTQPTTQEQTFDGVLRLRPGEPAVVGGVRYYSHKRDLTGLALDPNWGNLGSTGITEQANEMFIVVRPSVRVFGKQPKPGVTQQGKLHD